MEGSVLLGGQNHDENIKQETVEGSLLPEEQNNDVPSSSNAAESGETCPRIFQLSELLTFYIIATYRIFILTRGSVYNLYVLSNPSN